MGMFAQLTINSEDRDRTYILEDGKIALKGGKNILKDKKIKNIYFGGR
ncbi:high-affinity branched-chain amino acid transport [Candidatus Woesearchaeota archaeon]|nr:high-affinity branched-chain amino acid transport [Candidatus Woesearchaeota archaeon]